jgi:prepilin-type N-terminal cleavage/methylation domain-containing protein
MYSRAHTNAHARGVTLIEMLVAFAIVSVTFVAVVEAFLSSSRATQMAQRQAEVADALSYALADIAREAQISGEFEIILVPPANVEKQIKMTRITTVQVSGADAGSEIRYRFNNTIEKSIDGGPFFRLLPQSVKVPGYEIFPGIGTPARFILSLRAGHKEGSDSEFRSYMMQFTEHTF